MIYPPPFSPDDIISLVNWLPEDMLDEVIFFNVLNFDFVYVNRKLIIFRGQ